MSLVMRLLDVGCRSAYVYMWMLIVWSATRAILIWVSCLATWNMVPSWAELLLSHSQEHVWVLL